MKAWIQSAMFAICLFLCCTNSHPGKRRNRREDDSGIEVSCELVDGKRSTRSTYSRDVSCPGVASAVWGSLVQQESDQMVSAHSMLHMTVLEEAMRVGIELHFHLPWLHLVCCLL